MYLNCPYDYCEQYDSTSINLSLNDPDGEQMRNVPVTSHLYSADLVKRVFLSHNR